MKIKLLIFIVYFLFQPYVLTYSQDSVRILIISDKVGATIDRQERDKYHLFTRFKTFQEAVFYQESDSSYYCKVTYLQNDQPIDTTFTTFFSSIRNIATRIEYFDELKSGTSIDPEIQRVMIKYESGQLVPRTLHQEGDTSGIKSDTAGKISKRSNRRYGYLPINRSKFDAENLIKNNFKFGLSLGILYNSAKYNGLSTIFNEMEEKVPEEGYEFPKSAYDFSTAALMRIAINFLYGERYFGEVNSTFNFKTERTIHYKSFSLNAGYLFLSRSTVRPYLSAGFQLINFSVTKPYNITINSDNYMLESITMDGAGKAFRMNAGVLFKFAPNFNLNIFCSYNAAGNVELKYFPSETKVNLNSWEFGLSTLFF